ncbi:MAG: BLUF domain-containing protein [Gemmatimonadota bacterium]
MEPGKLTHLIYTSAAAPGFEPADLRSILQLARVKNARLSVTGILLYTAGSFFQVLEGAEATLAELFAVIARDPRHRRITKIIQEAVARRTFADWSMGYTELAAGDLEAVEGLSDFFARGSSLADLGAGRAKKLLSAFGQGRWRTRLQAEAR